MCANRPRCSSVAWFRQARGLTTREHCRSKMIRWRTPYAPSVKEDLVAKNEDDDLTVVPMPSSETQAEHDRIRKSNDHDQELEREGKPSRHNRGYDEVADGAARPPKVERVVDE
jgi:hypothetical protein